MACCCCSWSSLVALSGSRLGKSAKSGNMMGDARLESDDMIGLVVDDDDESDKLDVVD